MVAVEVEPAGIDGGPVGRDIRSAGQDAFLPSLLLFVNELFERKADMLFSMLGVTRYSNDITVLGNEVK